MQQRPVTAEMLENRYQTKTVQHVAPKVPADINRGLWTVVKERQNATKW